MLGEELRTTGPPPFRGESGLSSGSEPLLRMDERWMRLGKGTEVMDWGHWSCTLEGPPGKMSEGIPVLLFLKAECGCHFELA